MQSARTDISAIMRFHHECPRPQLLLIAPAYIVGKAGLCLTVLAIELRTDLERLQWEFSGRRRVTLQVHFFSIPPPFFLCTNLDRIVILIRVIVERLHSRKGTEEVDRASRCIYAGGTRGPLPI